MIRLYKDIFTNTELRVLIHNKTFWLEHNEAPSKEWLTIAWNTGPTQSIVVDNAELIFPSASILPLVANQHFCFSRPENVIAWQFNRDFYCIVNHDIEVSCVGFIFFGACVSMFLQLDKKQKSNMSLLLDAFEEEFEYSDDIRKEMLRVLLVRLIITITRIGKQQYASTNILEDNKFDLYRKFNLMVELSYRQQHEVQFYAASLNKSPKTLANVFAMYSKKKPSQIIYDRIVLEAKRLFHYTNKSIKK